MSQHTELAQVPGTSPRRFDPDAAAEARAIVERLHASYCRYAGITVRLRDDTLRQWWYLLKDYEHDEAALQADLKIVLIHLRSQIDKEKRNPGAVKLVNLLQPEQFESDVAEARFLRGRGRERADLPKPPDPEGWRPWVKDQYPSADLPAHFADLPPEVQREFHDAQP